MKKIECYYKQYLKSKGLDNYNKNKNFIIGFGSFILEEYALNVAKEIDKISDKPHLLGTKFIKQYFKRLLLEEYEKWLDKNDKRKSI